MEIGRRDCTHLFGAFGRRLRALGAFFGLLPSGLKLCREFANYIYFAHRVFFWESVGLTAMSFSWRLFTHSWFATTVLTIYHCRKESLSDLEQYIR